MSDVLIDRLELEGVGQYEFGGWGPGEIGASGRSGPPKEVASGRRRTRTALGAAAAAMVAAATVVVGAQLIGVTPPPIIFPSLYPGTYHCGPTGADPVFSHGRDPLVPYGPAVWNSRMPPVWSGVDRRRRRTRCVRKDEVTA